MQKNPSGQRPSAKPGNVVDNIKVMEEKRAARRAEMEEKKQQKQDRAENAKREGKICDIDFEMMITEQRKTIGRPLNHVSA